MKTKILQNIHIGSEKGETRELLRDEVRTRVLRVSTRRVDRFDYLDTHVLVGGTFMRASIVIKCFLGIALVTLETRTRKPGERVSKRVVLAHHSSRGEQRNSCRCALIPEQKTTH